MEHPFASLIAPRSVIGTGEASAHKGRERCLAQPQRRGVRGQLEAVVERREREVIATLTSSGLGKPSY
jgi:hypothetical protein